MLMKAPPAPVCILMTLPSRRLAACIDTWLAAKGNNLELRHADLAIELILLMKMESKLELSAPDDTHASLSFKRSAS